MQQITGGYPFFYGLWHLLLPARGILLYAYLHCFFLAELKPNRQLFLGIITPLITPILPGWWFQTWILFSIIYGMSSFPLTFIFFSMVKTTNQVSSEFFDDSQMVAGSWGGFPVRSFDPPTLGLLGLATSHWNTRNYLLFLTVKYGNHHSQ